MTRYTAASDLDYYDEPWTRPEPCATKDCDGVCDSPASGFCYDCRCKELEARAAANEEHRREQVQTR